MATETGMMAMMAMIDRASGKASGITGDRANRPRDAAARALLGVTGAILGAVLVWSITAAAWPGPVLAIGVAGGSPAGLAHRDGEVWTLRSTAGEVVTVTSMRLYPGDRYIDEKNRQFTVIRTSGQTAWAKNDGTLNLAALAVAPPAAEPELLAAASTSRKKKPVVAIYHTHSDESYVPTSGTSSKEWGDIYAVGRRLADNLRKQGFGVTWSKNNHNPHDGGAYLRSRRTVAELLRGRPDVIFDVHRDATPPQLYEKMVAGADVTRIRLVVGRQNPNQAANLEFAKRLKALADRLFPGLILGIFDAKGDYNQDVGPRSTLLEFGSHTNPLIRAENATRFFSEVVPVALGYVPGRQEKGQAVDPRSLVSPGAARSSESGAGWRGLIVVLGVFVVGVLAYLFINAGSAGEFRERMATWFDRLRDRLRVR